MRIELTQYILVDFRKDGVLHKYGEEVCHDIMTELIDDVRMVSACIREANAFYVTCHEEYIERRILQDRAVGYCERLSGELDIVAELFHKDINVDKYVRFAQTVKTEKGLIKAWRKSNVKLDIKT